MMKEEYPMIQEECYTEKPIKETQDSTFKVGDYVVLTERYGPLNAGTEGYVININHYSKTSIGIHVKRRLVGETLYGVKIFSEWQGGHSCDNRLKGENKYKGYYVPISDIKKISPFCSISHELLLLD